MSRTTAGLAGKFGRTPTYRPVGLPLYNQPSLCNMIRRERVSSMTVVMEMRCVVVSPVQY